MKKRAEDLQSQLDHVINLSAVRLGQVEELKSTIEEKGRQAREKFAKLEMEHTMVRLIRFVDGNEQKSRIDSKKVKNKILA